MNDVRTNGDGTHTFLVAVNVGPGMDRKAAEIRLSRYLPKPDDVIQEWWFAEDERYDGSDNDSAVFVHMGEQDKWAQLVSRGLPLSMALHQMRNDWQEAGFTTCGRCNVSTAGGASCDCEPVYSREEVQVIANRIVGELIGKMQNLFEDDHIISNIISDEIGIYDLVRNATCTPTPFDPNKWLSGIRHELGNLRFGDEGAWEDHAESMAEMFDGLDRWITGGGSLPEEWKGKSA